MTKGRVLSNDIDTYNVQNFTSKLHYDLTLNDEIVLSRDVDIALVRHYDGEKWDDMRRPMNSNTTLSFQTNMPVKT